MVEGTNPRQDDRTHDSPSALTVEDVADRVRVPMTFIDRLVLDEVVPLPIPMAAVDRLAPFIVALHALTESERLIRGVTGMCTAMLEVAEESTAELRARARSTLQDHAWADARRGEGRADVLLRWWRRHVDRDDMDGDVTNRPSNKSRSSGRDRLRTALARLAHRRTDA